MIVYFAWDLSKVMPYKFGSEGLKESGSKMMSLGTCWFPLRFLRLDPVFFGCLAKMAKADRKDFPPSPEANPRLFGRLRGYRWDWVKTETLIPSAMPHKQQW